MVHRIHVEKYKMLCLLFGSCCHRVYEVGKEPWQDFFDFVFKIPVFSLLHRQKAMVK